MATIESHTPSEIVGRRPAHGTLDFDEETSPAVIEQLVRAEFLCQQRLVQGRRVLDVGCGTGYTAHYLVRRGGAEAVVGLEVDHNLVEDNRAENQDRRIDFESYDGGKFPFPSEAFDVVTCFEVLEHVTQEVQRHLLEEIARVVRPSGSAVLSTPYRPVYSPDGISLNPDHINELDDYEFTALCKSSFGGVMLYGQRLVDTESFKARQRHHRRAHSSLGTLLRRVGVQSLVRYTRSLRSTPSFKQVMSQFRIATGIDDRSLVQLAICRQPQLRTSTPRCPTS